MRPLLCVATDGAAESSRTHSLWPGRGKRKHRTRQTTPVPSSQEVERAASEAHSTAGILVFLVHMLYHRSFR